VLARLFSPEEKKKKDQVSGKGWSMMGSVAGGATEAIGNTVVTAVINLLRLLLYRLGTWDLGSGVRLPWARFRFGLQALKERLGSTFSAADKTPLIRT